MATVPNLFAAVTSATGAQLDDDFLACADKAGVSSQTFSVAPATAADHAVPFGQEIARTFLSVKDYGVLGDGATNDTTALNLAIAAANAANVKLEFPDGVYVVTPGSLTTVSVGVHGPGAFLKAASATDSPLMTVYFSTRPGISNDSGAWEFDFGGFVDSTGSSYVGTGLYVKQAYRNRFIIRKAINLKYGIHFDTSWHTGAGAPLIYENDVYIKTDSCMVGLQITSGNDANDVPIDNNTFNISSSFNHFTAQIRLSAGTTSGHSDIHNNTFIIQDLELGQTNSDGIVCTGISINNQFFIRNMRGINGTGKYGRTDANSINNYFETFAWVPANWAFTTNQQVNTLRALDVLGTTQGRSIYFASSVAAAVSTTIPSIVGDTIINDSPTIGSSFGWKCTTAGTPGTWMAFGMRHTPFMGQLLSATGVSAGTTVYCPFTGSDVNASAVKVIQVLPTPGTLRNFYAKSSAVAGGGNTFTIKLVKNLGLVSPTITISGASQIQNTDLSTLVPVAAGDNLCWEITASAGTPANTIITISAELLSDPD